MNILNFEPRPLFASTSPLVLTWSPKSACTHFVMWFFVHEKMFYAANYYNAWPHTFRSEVYYKAATYRKRQQTFTDVGGVGYTNLRVLRDPTKRFVSCFRHACRHKFLQSFIIDKLGFDPAVEGLSLIDYYNALKDENLRTPSLVNIHACGQWHPVWEVNFDRTITLNIDETPMNQGLNAIEADLGMPITNFDAIPKFNMIREQHYTRDQDYAGTEPLETVRFRMKDTDPFPKKQFESMPLVRQMAEELYAADVGKVASGDTAGRLFQKVPV